MIRLNQSIFGLMASMAVCTLVAKDATNEQAQQFDLAVAEGKKIAFINTMEVMRDWTEAQEVGKEIQEKQEELTHALQDKQRKFAQARADFEKKAGVLSKSARESEEKKIAKLGRDLEAFAQECEEEFKTLVQQRSEQLDRDLRIVVAELGRDLQVDAIVDEATSRILYASDRVKMTQVVVESMNKNHELKVAQAASKGELAKAAVNNKNREARA